LMQHNQTHVLHDFYMFVGGYFLIIRHYVQNIGSFIFLSFIEILSSCQESVYGSHNMIIYNINIYQV
jgi:hypothetical protein